MRALGRDAAARRAQRLRMSFRSALFRSRRSFQASRDRDPADLEGCFQLCETNADCTEDLSVCVEPVVSDDIERTDVMACSVSCDPLVTAIGCPLGTRWALVMDGGAHTECRAGSAPGRNQACTLGEAGCSSGNVCYRGFCRQICDEEDDCSFGDCNPIATRGSTTFGACN